MPAYKNLNGSWYCSFYHKDWKGNNVRKKKAGFKTKRDALEWERKFIEQNEGNLEMSFEDFVEIYKEERMGRLKINEIEPIDVIRWQNELLAIRDDKGKGYSQTYLRTIRGQLRVVLNNVEYLEEDGIYNLIKKESSYEEMGVTYELRKDYMLYPTFNIIEKRRKIKHENYRYYNR